VVVNDISDTGVAPAWSALNGAQGYAVSREDAGDTIFKAVGSVAQPSFGDMGLSPAMSYKYKIAATGGGDGGGRRYDCSPSDS